MYTLLNDRREFVANLTTEDARRLILGYAKLGQRVGLGRRDVILPSGGFVYSHPVRGADMIRALHVIGFESNAWARIGGHPNVIAGHAAGDTDVRHHAPRPRVNA